ncbi:hypothetical protein GGH95_005759, partial [Coemansia sp. RSA 1836]
MSSRAVKRLLKERGYDELAESSAHIERRERELRGDDQASSDAEESQQAQPKANMFDLLMGGEDGGGNDDSEESDGSGAPPAPPPAAAAAAEGRRRAKGKRKGKGKKGATAATGSGEQTMEEFEAELAEFQQKLPESTVAADDVRAESGKGKGEALGVVLTEQQQRNRALLVADAKHLDSEAEIRRMFGSAAVKDKGRRLGAAAAGKRLTLSHPKASWPAMRAQAGVDMRAADAAELRDDPTGGSWFVVEHSGRFRSVQVEFLAAVQTHSADGVAAIAHHHPYHVDALLQLSEILKQTGGDFAEAGELVERALFAFEIGFAPRFSITGGMARLDFRYVESRTLYLA